MGVLVDLMLDFGVCVWCVRLATDLMLSFGLLRVSGYLVVGLVCFWLFCDLVFEVAGLLFVLLLRVFDLNCIG